MHHLYQSTIVSCSFGVGFPSRGTIVLRLLFYLVVLVFLCNVGTHGAMPLLAFSKAYYYIIESKQRQ